MTEEAQAGRPVVVTTEHRGVFFGYVPEGAVLDAKTIRIERARNCIYWDAEVRGVVGLAARGPIKESRVGPAAKAITLQNVTAVIEVTPAAAAIWESEPWV